MDCMACITRRIESQRQKEKITCPHCGHLQENDDGQYPVTYWAEDGAVERDCGNCGKTFWIKEYVERHYESGKKLDDMGDPTNKEE